MQNKFGNLPLQCIERNINIVNNCTYSWKSEYLKQTASLGALQLRLQNGSYRQRFRISCLTDIGFSTSVDLFASRLNKRFDKFVFFKLEPEACAIHAYLRLPRLVQVMPIAFHCDNQNPLNDSDGESRGRL